jgi:hypothetical protein
MKTVIDSVGGMTNVNVVITGNLGYLAPIVTRHLRRTHPNALLLGFDSAFFALSLRQ